jgi:uncharacterized protein YkuJ
MEPGHQDIMNRLERLENQVHNLKHRCFRLERNVEKLEDFIYGEEPDEEGETFIPEVSNDWP